MFWADNRVCHRLGRENAAVGPTDPLELNQSLRGPDQVAAEGENTLHDRRRVRRVRSELPTASPELRAPPAKSCGPRSFESRDPECRASTARRRGAAIPSKWACRAG